MSQISSSHEKQEAASILGTCPRMSELSVTALQFSAAPPAHFSSPSHVGSCIWDLVSAETGRRGCAMTGDTATDLMREVSFLGGCGQ